MKEIVLTRVEINNFKKIKSFALDFTNKHTTISGHYGCGKSTIKKSLDFVLGLKVDDVRPHEIANGEWVEIDGVEPTSVVWFVRKVDENGIVANYKLQVITDKGGTKTKYYVDDQIIGTKSQYQEQLVNIFGVKDFETLEYATQLNNFMSLNWTNQRAILKELTNSNQALEQIKTSEKYKDLYEDFFAKGYDEVAIGKSLTKQKKDLESEKDKVLGAIREQESIKSSVSNIEKGTIQNEINAIDKRLNEINELSTNKDLDNALEKLALNNNSINTLKASVESLESTITYNNEHLKVEREKYERESEARKEKVEEIVSRVKALQESKLDYKETYVCEYCGSSVKNKKTLEEATKEFEENKANEINGYNLERDGLLNAQRLCKENIIALESKTNTDIESKKALVQDYKNQIANLESDKEILNADIEYYKTLQGKDYTQEINDLKAKKETLLNELAKATLLDSANERLAQLNETKTTLLENIQKNIQLEELRKDYSLDTMSVLENHINKYFTKDIQWKLFEKLITTGEYKESLVLLSRGRRYDTACSSGERILANLLVVVGLQNILGVNLPIFVDDYNSIGESFNTSQQLILLETNPNASLTNVELY